MKIGITQRLFLAILLATALAVASMVIIMQINLDRGFLRLVNTMEKRSLSRLAPKLEALYQAEGSFSGLQQDPRRWNVLLAESLVPDDLGMPPREPQAPCDDLLQGNHRRPLPPRIARAFAMRLYLLDENRQPILKAPADSATGDLTPLRAQGKLVGYLCLSPQRAVSEEHQLRFLKQQKDSFLMVAVVLLLVAGALSHVLANRLIRPLKGLAAGTHALAAGEYTTRVPVTSADEVGQLAEDFNLLALTLEKNEQARRQWVADISHELRTPLAVLRGEIEAMQDGIRQPDAAALNSLHDEALRLGRLVEDLHQLSLADLGALTYRKARTDLVTVVEKTIAAAQAAFAGKGIAVTMDIPSEPIEVFADRQRLRQLLNNLLDNSLKYTDAGGTCRIALTRTKGMMILDLEDSAPGVAEHDLDRLFERLYRVESSRNRKEGGAGLGLAICRSIAEAHGGTIECRQSNLGGLWLRVTLPLMEAHR